MEASEDSKYTKILKELVFFLLFLRRLLRPFCGAVCIDSLCSVLAGRVLIRTSGRRTSLSCLKKDRTQTLFGSS